MIAITGATGFVGKNLTHYLQSKNIQTHAIPHKDLYDTGKLKQHLQNCNAIIHLAGFPITKRWTKKNREKIYNSRVITTRNIVHCINTLENPPSVFISTSATGIYNPKETHDENSKDYSENFLGTVCQAWEKPLTQINTQQTRIIISRFGIVLGNQGMLQKLKPLFKLGIGGKIGHGKYPMPFIHINDLLHFYEVSLTNANYKGVYNLVSPQKITNKDFTKALAQALNKKAPFTIPLFFLKIIMGKGISALINNPIVIPKKLQDANFQFKYDKIEAALKI